MSVLVIGGGKIGTYLASLLISQGYSVKVIESNGDEMPRLKRELPENVVVWGSGTDPNVLEASGIRQAQVVAAVTGEDEVNLVAASLARFEFKVPRIIGRVNNPKNAWLYTAEMGVDVALNQADLIARLIAEEMSLGDMMTLVKLRKGLFSIVEEKVHPTAPAAGKPIRELKLPAKCVLIAVLRKGEMILAHGDTVLQPVDEVIALVHESQVADLARLLGKAA
ncbi:MAG: TrkA family potassium uptake protein [Chloroflexi bacterium]|nr:TrkA family potassium uptake protein [Chloroflexota bacterium]